MRIGVEEEFHVLEAERGRLVPRADAILRGLPRRTFTTELHQCTVETNSAVHASLHDLYADLTRLRRQLDAAAFAQGLAVVAAGTAPLATTAAVPTTADARYRHMADEYRKVADEQLICGAQVHVDVPDRDTAVRVMCEVSPWLPVLLAVSASSPLLAGDRHGVRELAFHGVAALAHRGPAGLFLHRGRVRRGGGRPDPGRGHQRRGDDLLRRPSLRPSADAGTAHM
ncbi:hypothetical protein GCM10020295_79790 [Streptomyces cinereospinus]